jgi:hypothetical protein
MTDTSIRLAVVLSIVVIAGMAAVMAGRAKRARPVITTRTDLAPGVHLFTSSTCRTCKEARRVVASTYGNEFREIRHEEDPESFGRHGITRVPTAIVMFLDGEATVFEGVPRKRDLPVRRGVQRLRDDRPPETQL